MKRLLVFSCLCLILLGCGFELRKPVQLDEHLQTIAITPHDPYRPLQRTVREALMYSGANVTSDPALGLVILNLHPEHVERSTYAVDSTGDVAQELLAYTLTFELLDKNNVMLIPTQSIRTDRVLYIHSDQLLSVNREERTLIDDMRQESVEQLIQRLAAYRHED